MSVDKIADYLAQFSQVRTQLLDQLRRAIVGQADVIEQILAAIFTRGHCLLVGVPGLAKTLMVSSIAQILDVSFKRVQFTPDLMPSDVTGTHVFDLQKQQFTLSMGPVFADFLLADEINRAPAKTQAALLQAMQERTVTIDRTTYRLPPGFTVFATQNPIEFEGTYPLPEAQKDRFLLRIPMGFPSREEELELIRLLESRAAAESAEAAAIPKAKATNVHGAPSAAKAARAAGAAKAPKASKASKATKASKPRTAATAPSASG